MAQNKKYYTDDLEVGTVILVKGNLEFSKLSKKYVLDELEQRISDTERAGAIPIVEPHVTATISDTNVVGFNLKEKPDNYNEREYKEKIQTFIKERLFTPRSNSYANAYSISRRYYIDNFVQRNRDREDLIHQGQPTRKGWEVFARENLPDVYYRTKENPDVLNKVTLENELAKNSSVILVLRVYGSNSGRGARKHNGLSLDGVIVNGEIKYFGNTQEDNLSMFGFTIKDKINNHQYENYEEEKDDFSNMDEEKAFEETFGKDNSQREEGVLNRPDGYKEFEESLGYEDDYSEDFTPYEGENPYHSNERPRQGIVTEDDTNSNSGNGFLNAF